MSPTPTPSPEPTTGFPRVSGDEPLSFLEFFLRPMFSPRERG